MRRRRACVCQFINIIYNLIQHEQRLRAVCAHSIFIGQLWLWVYGVPCTLCHTVESISKKKKNEKLETAKYEGVHFARAPGWNIHIHSRIEIEIIAFFVNFNDSQFIQWKYENLASATETSSSRLVINGKRYTNCMNAFEWIEFKWLNGYKS